MIQQTSMLDAALPGFYQASPPREREHITQKPVEIMRSLMRIVPPGGMVLDPFCGSGTTGVAALLEGRRFIGSEQSAHFVEVARKRCGIAAQQGTEQSIFDLACSSGATAPAGQVETPAPQAGHRTTSSQVGCGIPSVGAGLRDAEGPA